MSKKMKISDLEEDELLVEETQVEEEVVDIDKLEEGDGVVTVEDKQELVHEEVFPNPKKIRKIICKGNLTRAMIYKFLSFLMGLLLLDISLYVMKYFEGVDILNMNNYRSMYLDFTFKEHFILFGLLIVFVYLTTKRGDIVFNRLGIYFTKSSFSKSIFLVQSSRYAKWEEIYEVKYEYKIFEPYLILFGNQEQELGILKFNLEDSEEFFSYIKKYAGTEHPLYSLKKTI